jgi:hypothetical protein
MLVFALVQGNAKGWSSPIIVGLLIGSGVAMGVFLVAEWRRRDPMLDLSLFRRPAMVGVSLAAFTISASIFAAFLYLTLYLQEVLGYGPFQAGLRFLPITVLAFVVAPLSGKLLVVVQSRYLLSLGLLCVALGCALASHVQPDSTWTVLLPGFILAGIGLGIANPVLASASVAVVPAERSGMASGSSSTFRQVGISTGIATLGAVFLSQIKPDFVNALAASPVGRSILARGTTQLNAVVAGGDVRTAALDQPSRVDSATLIDAYKVGFTTTFNHLMTIALVISLVGAIGSFFLVRQRDFVTGPTLDGLQEGSRLVGDDPTVMTPGSTHGTPGPRSGSTNDAGPGGDTIVYVPDRTRTSTTSTPPWRPAAHSRRRSRRAGPTGTGQKRPSP